MHHKTIVALCSVVTCPGMNGLSQLLPERKRGNDSIVHHATPHVNLCHVPLMVNNFLRWLTTPNSADVWYYSDGVFTRGKNTRVQENHITVDFLQHFLKTSLDRLVWCAATTAICRHVTVNICIQCHELWDAGDANACLLWESTCVGYVEMRV
jgi:hypothetical protein